MDKKNENHARSDGSKEDQCEQGQRQTKDDWDDAGDGDDKIRVQMTKDERDDANDRKARIGGDITKSRSTEHLWHASVACHKIDQISSLRAMQVCCAMADPSASDLELVKRIGRCPAGKPRAECPLDLRQSGERESYSDADWGGDNVTRLSVSAGVIMRGGIV